MENITNTHKQEINILIQKLVNHKIPDLIEIDYISNLFEIIEKNRTIPIEYYTKNLTEISTELYKKCNFITCKRKALYIDDQKNMYCWIHCQKN